MAKLAPPGQNPEITALDVAASVGAAWTKACGQVEADVRTHIVLCREQGDEAAAQAFLPLGRDAWWVPLYAEPGPETAAPILAEDNDKERRENSFWNFERGASLNRLLDVIRLVPASREAALERFMTRAEQLIEELVQEFPGDEQAFERLHIPYGLLARESLPHARALVDAHPQLLQSNGGLIRRPRWGATSYVAELLRVDFEAALACAPVLNDSAVYELTDDALYGLELGAERWITFTRAATKAAAESSTDVLLSAVASRMRRSFRPDAAELALAIYAARESVDSSHLDLLIELGRHEAARILLESIEGHAEDPGRLSDQRFILGLDSLEQAHARMVGGVLPGQPPKTGRSRGMKLESLQRLTRLARAHTPDDQQGLAELDEQRAKLLSGGPEIQYDQGMWGRFEAQELLFRMQALGPTSPLYGSVLNQLVRSVKSNASSRRRFVAGEVARSLAALDLLAAVKIAKIKSPQVRSEAAIWLCRAFLPLDPGGALSVLCSMCPKQSSRSTSELLDGSADVLRAVYL